MKHEMHNSCDKKLADRPEHDAVT